jgi:hypothetical protein
VEQVKSQSQSVTKKSVQDRRVPAKVPANNVTDNEQHVNTVARSCFYELCKLHSVRRSLTDDATHARVDYCNAILYGVTDGVARRLQAVLNSAAMSITGARQVTTSLRSSETLCTGRLLRVLQRIINIASYKVALMSFDCVHDTCPAYFASTSGNLRCIRPSLNHKTACSIANSLVHCNLDYCYSLHVNLPASQLSRLQLIQNALARSVVSAWNRLID